MKGLGVTANVIAVVELVAEIASACARADIECLRREVNSLAVLASAIYPYPSICLLESKQNDVGISMKALILDSLILA
jgi:hypothetical protein